MLDESAVCTLDLLNVDFKEVLEDLLSSSNAKKLKYLNLSVMHFNKMGIGPVKPSLEEKNKELESLYIGSFDMNLAKWVKELINSLSSNTMLKSFIISLPQRMNIILMLGISSNVRKIVRKKLSEMETPL